MKKKMLMFRNQLLILGFGSLMIVSCSKEDLDDLFGGDKNCRKDTTVVDNGSSCLTCGNDSMVDIGDTTIYDDPKEGGGGQQDSVVLKDSVDGNECYDKNLIIPTYVYPAVWKPVCGCDGVTYPSDEEARFIYGVKNYTDGPCKNYDKNKDSEEDGLVFTY